MTQVLVSAFINLEENKSLVTLKLLRKQILQQTLLFCRFYQNYNELYETALNVFLNSYLILFSLSISNVYISQF